MNDILRWVNHWRRFQVDGLAWKEYQEETLVIVLKLFKEMTIATNKEIGEALGIDPGSIDEKIKLIPDQFKEVHQVVYEMLEL